MNEDVPESEWLHPGGFQARMTAEDCTDSKVRMAAFAGRGGMETQSSMW